MQLNVDPSDTWYRAHLFSAFYDWHPINCFIALQVEFFSLRSTKSYKTSARASTIKNWIKLIRLVFDSTGVKLGERKDKLLYSFISPRYSPNDQLLVKILWLGAFEYLHLLAQVSFKLSFSVHQAIFSFFFLLIPLKFIFHFRWQHSFLSPSFTTESLDVGR